MIWIQENKGLAVLFGFFIVLALVLAVLTWLNRSEYVTQYAQFDTNRTTIQTKERSKLYPDEESFGLQEKATTEYQTKQKELYGKLTGIEGVEETEGSEAHKRPFQRGLNETLAPSVFQDNLGAYLRDYSDPNYTNGVKFPEGFDMDFGDWVSTIAPQQAVGKLDYLLRATKELLDLAISAGVTEIRKVERTKVEKAAPAPTPRKGNNRGNNAPAKKVKKNDLVDLYTIKLTMKTSHQGLQTMINYLSNDIALDKPFFSIRQIRIENTPNSTPPRKQEFTPRAVPVENPLDPVDPLTGAPVPTDPIPLDPAFPGGTSDAMIDVQNLLGTEELDVYMVVDVKRFLPPKEEKAKGKTPKNN